MRRLLVDALSVDSAPIGRMTNGLHECVTEGNEERRVRQSTEAQAMRSPSKSTKFRAEHCADQRSTGCGDAAVEAMTSTRATANAIAIEAVDDVTIA